MADDGVHLRAMSDDEVREYVQRIEVEYAEDMHTNGGLTLEVARERARASTEEPRARGAVRAGAPGLGGRGRRRRAGRRAVAGPARDGYRRRARLGVRHRGRRRPPRAGVGTPAAGGGRGGEPSVGTDVVAAQRVRRQRGGPTALHLGGVRRELDHHDEGARRLTCPAPTTSLAWFGGHLATGLLEVRRGPDAFAGLDEGGWWGSSSTTRAPSRPRASPTSARRRCLRRPPPGPTSPARGRARSTTTRTSPPSRRCGRGSGGARSTR
nr:hypothetical protein [Angustibacter aerolatus]